MNGMRKLLFILMVLPFTLNVRAEDPPSMLEKAVSNIKRWEGWHWGKCLTSVLDTACSP